MAKKADSGLNLKDFKLNEEGSFSITRPYESAQIIYLIENFIRYIEKDEIDLSNRILTDATACMGGDLVRFSKYFRMINGIEILEENFILLVQNCKQFGCHNVNLFCQNYIEIYDKLKQDVIYLDPPWGGTSYKNKDFISLKMGDLELWELVNLIKEKRLTKFIFIKAPMNVCLEKLEYDSIHIIYNKSKIASFKLICMSLVT
jgi:adenine-specific DNA methylase